MPRLTKHQYLADRDWLALLWREEHTRIGRFLGPREQWDLHEFYAFSEDMPPQVALAHRNQVQRFGSSLPQRAGRALKKLNACLLAEREAWERQQTELAAAPAADAAPKKRLKGKVVVTSAVVKPQVDIDVMSRALLKAAEDLQRRDDDAA